MLLEERGNPFPPGERLTVTCGMEVNGPLLLMIYSSPIDMVNLAVEFVVAGEGFIHH